MSPVVPSPGPFGQDLYNELQALARDDVNQSWALLALVTAIGSGFDPVESWARDGAQGQAGWSILVDLDRAPIEALPWLGQFVGVSIPSSLDDATARARIFGKAGFSRGTLPAIAQAAQTHLTGSKDVLIIERYQGDAYKLYVATRTAQTPSTTKTLADIIAAKPAALGLVYETITGQTFNELLTDSPLFSNVFSNYLTMQGVLTGVHGT